jgi:hypothetical protein
MAIDDVAAKRANHALNEISSHNQATYYSAVPLHLIYDAIEKAGYTIPESEKSCILCGHEGRADWPLYHFGKPSKRWLHLTWYRMPSGRFEITTYVS